VDISHDKAHIPTQSMPKQAFFKNTLKKIEQWLGGQFLRSGNRSLQSGRKRFRFFNLGN
jgi:hypothetical protein